MLWQGKYGWLPALAVSAGLPIVLFLVFENGFWCRCRKDRSSTCSVTERPLARAYAKESAWKTSAI